MVHDVVLVVHDVVLVVLVVHDVVLVDAVLYLSPDFYDYFFTFTVSMFHCFQEWPGDLFRYTWRCSNRIQPISKSFRST